MVNGPQNDVSIWRRFVIPFLFVLALFVALFLRRPDAEAPVSNSGVEEVAKQPAEMVLRGETMGTTYNIKMVPETLEQAQTWHTLQAKIDQRLEAINNLMSTYRPQSDISKLNANTGTEKIELPQEFARVVAASLKIGEETGVMLAISLHAVHDELRDELVPINRKYKIAELMDACRDYSTLSNARAEWAVDLAMHED